jgi:hypothetical protein
VNAAAGRKLQRLLRAAESCQPAGALALDQGAEPLVKQRGPLVDAGEPVGFLEQALVQVDGRAHRQFRL